MPDKWRHLTKLLTEDSWEVVRISGSHRIYTKPGRRCIPVAFHGGSVTRKYAKLVLRQAGLVGQMDEEDTGVLNNNTDEWAGLSTSGVGDVSVSCLEESARIPSPQRLSYVTEQEKQ